MGISIVMHTSSLDIARTFDHFQLGCSGTGTRGKTPCPALYLFLFPSCCKAAGMQCRPMRDVTSTAHFVTITT